MTETVVLEAKNRAEKRKRQVGRLRKSGFTPCIVYGHGEEPTPVSVAAEDLDRIVRSGERVVTLKTESGTQTVVIRDLQWDFLGREMLHADFKRVSADEKIEMVVPVALHGTAPGAVTGGGVLEQPLHTFNIECLPGNAPSSIEVNINELELGDAIAVKDVALPEGVVITDDEEAIVVQVVAPADESEEGEGGEEGTGAEPEVIGRPAGEDEGEGEES